MTTIDTFFDTTEITGALTPEQAAQVLSLPQEGETAPVADLAGAPALAPAEPAAVVEPPTTNEPEPEPAILAKDGKHLIPFDKLTEARESAQRAATERDEARRLAAELQAQLDAAKAPKVDPPQAVDLAALRRDRANALLDGDIEKVLQIEETLDAEARRVAKEEAIQSIKAENAAVAEAAAMAAMEHVAQDARTKYPALDHHSDKADKAAIAFVVAKRDALREQGEAPHKALEQAVSKAAEIFRWSGQQAAPTAPDARAAAAAAAAVIANAKAPTPATLSDIPGGKPAGTSFEAQLAAMSGPEQVAAIQKAGWSREQIESYLNRTV